MTSHGVPRAQAGEKSGPARQKELEKIREYRGLVDELQSKITAREFTAESLALTSKILKRNPEYYTVWNDRRRILSRGLFVDSKSSDTAVTESGSRITTASSSSFTTSAASARIAESCLGLIRSDLAFLVPLLREFPKCYWIWNYRVWLLEQATARLPRAVARGLWQEELGLVGKMLAHDGRNFHGWGYRGTVVDRLESAALAPDGHERTGKSMVEAEFAYTRRMIGTNLSNFSAWHYRTTLIPRLLQERGADDTARREFLDDEFKLITNALFTDSDDQSLWFYHEWLMSIYATAAPHRILPDLALPEKQARLVQQLHMLADMLDGAEHCKWIYEALLRYTVALKKLRQGHEQDALDTAGVADDAKIHDWLMQLRGLDPLRKGRWDDLEKSLFGRTRAE